MTNAYDPLMYIQDLILYLALFGIATFSLYLFFTNKYKGIKRNIFAVLGLGLPIMLISIKLMQAPSLDYHVYFKHIPIVGHMPFEIYFMDFLRGDMELTYWLYARISVIVGSAPYIAFYLYAITSVLAIFCGLNRTRLLPVQKALIYILFLLVIFPMGFSIIRQAAAIPICFLAVTYLIDKKLNKFVVCCILAGLFHTSSLIVLPIGLIAHRFLPDKFENSPTRSTIAITTLLLARVTLFSIGYLLFSGTKYSAYFMLEDGFGNAETKSLFFVRLLLFLLITVLLTLQKYKNNKPDAKLWQLFFFSSIPIIMFLPITASQVIGRFGYYFDLVLIWLLVVLVGGIKKRHIRTICYIGIVACGIIYFMIFYWLRNNMGIFPFYTIWSWGF